MRFRKPLFWILLFLGNSCTGYAQINTIKFEKYTANEGLSQSTVKCIQQDTLGFLWFGTINGLNRFDGLQFKSYYADSKDSTSLTSSNVTALFEDSRGNFWVGTAAGLNLLHRATDHFQRFTHLQSNLNSLPNNYVQDIFEDKSGNLWIATKGGLCRYDFSSHQFKNYLSGQPNSKSMASNNVSCLYEDSYGNFWVGYRGLDGLQKFNPATSTFTSVLFDQSEQEKTPLNVTVETIFEDSQKNLWIGTNEKGLLLYRRDSSKYEVFDVNQKTKKPLNASTILDIEEDEKGNLLLATEGGGLNVLNLEAFANNKTAQFAHYQVEPLNPYSINDNFLQSIYKDKTGLIWIGTKDSGINKIDKGIQKFTHYQSNQIAGNNLTNKDVWSIMQDHVGSVWVGTADGLNRIDAERINIEYFYHTPNNPTTISGNHIYAIFQDTKSDIWIGTDQGLNKLSIDEILNPSFISFKHEKGNRQTISDNFIRCFAEDAQGNFWIGTNQGLNLMNRNQNTFRQIHNPKSSGSNIIRCMVSDRKNRLWLGTEKGLVRYNPKNKKFINYLSEEGNASSLSNNIIHCLFEDENGALWIGTPEGLNKLIEKEGGVSFEAYDIKSGLPDISVYAIRGDRQGNLWLSTNTGLTRFNPETKEVKVFTNRDGLQDGEFNPNSSYKNWKGELFFGGSDGLNSFHPKTLPLNQEKPKVVLTDFKIDYKPVPVQKGGQLEKNISIADKVTLFPGDNQAFQFEFVALNYTLPQKNEYKFKLENYDRTWQFPDNQNIAFYTNIDPGTYTFKVQAANNDGVWNEEGASIEVVIQPTLVQTWYFKVGLLLLVAGLGYLIYLNRVRSLRQRSVTLEKMVKERTEQLERKNTELASTVKTLENTQQQLVVSEKMASLGQLTAGIAHEINNPINFISSNVQALKMDFQDMQNVLKKVKELEKTKNPKQLSKELIDLGKQLDYELLEEEIGELLAGIERGTERTVNIVSSLRTFSRNSTDNFSKADIHEGINSTLTILNSQFNGHIQIEKAYDDLPPIHCQISRLNQVFLNIINNSIQAIDAKFNGSTDNLGLIRIHTKRNLDTIKISIQDNGCGMDEKTQKRLFEPFYTTKDVGQGTGLGLSISYGIIEQHHGKIEVNSQPNKGTKFCIYLPIEQPA
ncbi:MAG: two-component regulator propeller domain-containing protein [Bacteroidota bacterium]